MFAVIFSSILEKPKKNNIFYPFKLIFSIFLLVILLFPWAIFKIFNIEDSSQSIDKDFSKVLAASGCWSGKIEFASPSPQNCCCCCGGSSCCGVAAGNDCCPVLDTDGDGVADWFGTRGGK